MGLLSPSRLAFEPIDPLENGLGDDIARERNDLSNVFCLDDETDAGTLIERWSAILESDD